MSTSDRHEPNAYGFGGAGTVPDIVEETEAERRHEEIEKIAVPADDLAGPINDAMTEAGRREPDEDEPEG